MIRVCLFADQMVNGSILQVKLQTVQIASLQRENDDLRAAGSRGDSRSGPHPANHELEQKVKVLQAMNAELMSNRGANTSGKAGAPAEWVLEQFEQQGVTYLVDAHTRLVYDNFVSNGSWPRPIGTKVRTILRLGSI
jgi:hypothetical protein